MVTSRLRRHSHHRAVSGDLVVVRVSKHQCPPNGSGEDEEVLIFTDISKLHSIVIRRSMASFTPLPSLRKTCSGAASRGGKRGRDGSSVFYSSGGNLWSPSGILTEIYDVGHHGPLIRILLFKGGLIYVKNYCVITRIPCMARIENFQQNEKYYFYPSDFHLIPLSSPRIFAQSLN